MQEKQKLFLDNIEQADMILIGIGEEFSERFLSISEHAHIMSALDKIEGTQEKEWIVPFLEKKYLDEIADGKILNAYHKLYERVKDKNYFIVTSCIDGLIHKADFAADRIVEPCGNYKMLQCSGMCSKDLYLPEEYCRQIEMAVDKETSLEGMEMPVCPKCGKKLVFNNILCENNYVEEGYLPAWEKYTKWIQFTLNKKLCILELGVGMHLPNLIRWPFEKVAFYNNKASFFRVNEALYQMAEELSGKGISIEKNALDFLTSF